MVLNKALLGARGVVPEELYEVPLAAALRPGSPERAASFVAHLDSPGRVVLEVVPLRRIGFDGAKMWQAAPSAAPPGTGSAGPL